MDNQWRGRIIRFGITVIGVLLVMMIYELWWWCGLGLGVIALFAVPRMNYYRRKSREEEQVYHQVTTYMEQLLCSYKRTGQILPSLQDCVSIFQDDDMKQTILKTIHVMRTGEGVEDGDITKSAFEIMERAYPSRRMKMIHSFICQAEATGGEREDALDILLEEIQLWRQRTQLYQKKKSFIRIDTMIAVGLSALMCYISKLLTPSELGIRLPETMLYQIATSVVLGAFVGTIVLVWKKLTGSWLDSDEMVTEKQEQSMDKQYDILKGHIETKSRIKHNLALRICRREVEKIYPYWLLSVTLQMQTESVYSAIEKSCHSIAGIFKREVGVLLEEIYQEPSALQPYLNFFQELSIPEVQTGMKILYSVCQNGYEDSRRQLDFLISNNNQCMDRSQSHHYENQVAGLSMLKHMPMMIACVKLLADLVNLLALTMGMFQQIV